MELELTMSNHPDDRTQNQPSGDGRSSGTQGSGSQDRQFPGGLPSSSGSGERRQPDGGRDRNERNGGTSMGYEPKGSAEILRLLDAIEESTAKLREELGRRDDDAGEQTDGLWMGASGGPGKVSGESGRGNAASR